MRASELRLHNPEAGTPGIGSECGETIYDDHETVLERAEKYMIVQAMPVWDALQNGHSAWREAYRALLDREYAELLVHIQDRGPLLDIGGGMGAIDAMLYAKGVASTVTILDGWADEPRMISQDEPFSNATVARAFLTLNGVAEDDLYFIDPRNNPQQALSLSRSFQNVISLRSWCFHYAPTVYAAAVYTAVTPGGRIIVDVRKGREWEAGMERWFGPPRAVIHEREKYVRTVYRRD